MQLPIGAAPMAAGSSTGKPDGPKHAGWNSDLQNKGAAGTDPASSGAGKCAAAYDGEVYRYNAGSTSRSNACSTSHSDSTSRSRAWSPRHDEPTRSNEWYNTYSDAVGAELAAPIRQPAAGYRPCQNASMDQYQSSSRGLVATASSQPPSNPRRHAARDSVEMERSPSWKPQRGLDVHGQPVTYRGGREDQPTGRGQDARLLKVREELLPSPPPTFSRCGARSRTPPPPLHAKQPDIRWGESSNSGLFCGFRVKAAQRPLSNCLYLVREFAQSASTAARWKYDVQAGRAILCGFE